MLTEQLIKSNKALEGLSPEQMTAIVELSKADENVVIAKKTKEHWDAIDQDIEAITGSPKPTSVKSYDHMKSVLTKFKETSGSATTLQAAIDKLKGEKSELEKAIKSGVTSEDVKKQIQGLEQKVKDSEKTISDLRGDLKTKETEYQKGLKEEADKNTSYRFDSTYASALVGVKFKDGLDKTVIDDVITRAKEKTLSLGTPEFMKGEDGKETIIFRDKDNLIISNPEDGQKPFTATNVFLQNLKGIIDPGKQQPGGGGGPSKPTPGAKVDLSGANTKQQAVELIGKHLAANGIAAGTKEFTKQQQELYVEHKVGEMPTKEE